MKKMVRWYYKEHLFFLIATILMAILFFRIEFRNWTDIADLFTYADETEYLRFCVELELDIIANFVTSYCYFDFLLWILAAAIFLRRVFYYYSISHDSGRCYFASMPFHKTDYAKFYWLRDVSTIVITILSIGVYAYFSITSYLNTLEVRIPWLLAAITGLSVFTCCYCLFLLGIYVFLESLFTNGILKGMGTIGIMGILYMLFEKIKNSHFTNKFLMTCYDFALPQATAGNSYRVETSEQWYSTTKLVHALEATPYLYRGEARQYMVEGNTEGYCQGSFCRLFDFGLLETYLLDSLIYLFIGLILAGVAIWLTGRWEESKTGLYHVGTKYGISALFGVAVFVMYYQTGMTFGKIMIGVLEGVLVFGLFVYLFKAGNIKTRKSARKN